MNTPIYDSTKMSFESFEKNIDDFYSELDRKIEEAKKDSINWTKDRTEQLKSYFEKRIESIKARFQKEQDDQNKKFTDIKEKLEKLKSILELIKNPPNIDTIVDWAKSVAELYSIQYQEIAGKVVDITKTTTYIASETPVIITKLTQLPIVLAQKIASLPTPK